MWFGKDGKVADVISEDAPPDGRTPASRAFALADPGASARLVAEWNAAPPAGLQAIIWYRLPVAGDQRNWSWTTLDHVIRGEDQPSSLQLESRDHDGAQDLFIVNRGPFPAPLPAVIRIRSEVLAADGAGAYVLDPDGDGLRFSRRVDIWPWLDPEKKIPAGWLRARDPSLRIDWTFTQ